MQKQDLDNHPMVRVIKEATYKAVETPRQEWDTALFPYWSQGAHELFKMHGCPCDTPACFAKQDKQTQLTLLSGNLDFPFFISCIEEAITRFVQSFTNTN